MRMEGRDLHDKSDKWEICKRDEPNVRFRNTNLAVIEISDEYAHGVFDDSMNRARLEGESSS